MTVATGEILFVKSVKDGIPNRDPLNDSDARRIFGEEDGRISLSDVSIKRDVRDYVLAKYPDGGPDKRYFVWCRGERTPEGKLYDRDKLAELILERAGRKNETDEEQALLKSSFDMRVFGAVFSVKNKSFHKTGPVQFGWAHSLHPVETKYVQGTVVMPSGEQAGQGTIWTTYILPFAVFAMPGVINATIAQENKMSEADVELLLEGLWKGTLYRQARGRGLQQPLLLVHVEYNDPFFRIGYLEDYITLEPGREAWLGASPPTQLSDVTLDVRELAKITGPDGPFASRIKRVRWWKNPELRLLGELSGSEEKMW
ncbi:CRISPR-associated protein [Desulfofundulus thermosubterraneus]|uniref:CRISPR-associated protein, Csh2 family n=1 Tax=Desulfofundulus thermosubterraneus DSM 16057 TaxID=1121432 RepID=A0A1M6MEL9_9FIRM|nr:type I CRISPR-associated protein Cas7 [Desulfofundulus thermosubterraneus]SHJ81962.1 CRISPR-associated protein, Csh2 family [Desulfofundulus thermosubterraneus DSM 16057]